MKKVIMFMMLISTSLLALADGHYVVNAKIYDNEQLLATPTLMAKETQQASILVEGSYTLTLIVSSVNETTVNVNTTLVLGEEAIAPTFIAKLGQDASIEVGTTKLLLNISHADE